MAKYKSSGNTAYIGFFAKIDAQSAQKLLETITKLPRDIDTLYLMLSSSGGSVSYGFVIYNFLRGLHHKLVMHNVGSVDSIGNVVFMAADERYATSNGTFLIHGVKRTAKGESEESYMHEKISCLHIEEKKIREVFEARSKMPAEDLEHLFRSGELKEAQYALASGLIRDIRDLVIPPGSVVQIVQTPAESKL